jgi:hypothetical protein
MTQALYAHMNNKRKKKEYCFQKVMCVVIFRVKVMKAFLHFPALYLVCIVIAAGKVIEFMLQCEGETQGTSALAVAVSVVCILCWGSWAVEWPVLIHDPVGLGQRCPFFHVLWQAII